MSGTEVDLDRLAEYAAGLLDPAQSADVERLVTTEPAWADTLAALTAAQPLVRDALAALTSPPVPDDVAARLEAAIPAPAAGLAAGADVVRLSERRGGARRAGGLSPWTRAAATVTAFAAGIAVCIGGLQLVRGHSTASDSSATGGNLQPNRPDAAAAPSTPMILTSGRNYTQQTVTSVGPTYSPSGEQHGMAEQGNPTGAATPKDLQRLTAASDLRTCLGMVTAAHGGAARVVDYAQYQGQPALVVVLSGAGTGEVVVVGPRCGLPGSGTDQLYATSLR